MNATGDMNVVDVMDMNVDVNVDVDWHCRSLHGAIGVCGVSVAAPGLITY